MTIENQLERIANSIEGIRQQLTLMTQEPAAALNEEQPTGKKRGRKPAAAPTTSAPEVDPFAEDKSEEITSSEQLRAVAQKVMVEAEKKGLQQEFVTYIQQGICKKLSPENPKLIAIPTDKLPEAAEMIQEYATKKGLVVNG